MHFYNIKFQKNTFIKKVLSGNFSNKFINEFLIIKIKSLDLFEIDRNGILRFITSTLIFGTIISIAKLKVLNSNKNFINCGSNSGGISFLKYSTNDTWINIFTHFFGRSGCRRVVPGYYICNDFKGRVCIIAAIEKLRFVYIIDYDSKNSGIISSPVEIQKTNSIITKIIALKNEFNNPCFATIELDKYEINELSKKFFIRISKFLIFYEFDLGLNILVTSYLVKLNIESNLIIPLHYDFLNTSSCLIDNNGFVTLKSKYKKEIFLTLPKRIDEELEFNNILTINTSLIYKNKHIYLVQDESGNLFQLNTSVVNKHSRMYYSVSLRHIDTIKPSYNIEILKKGFLFISSINSYHSLMKFNNEHLLDDIYFIKSTQLTNLSDIFIRPLFKNFKKDFLIEIKRISNLCPVHDVKLHYDNYTNDNKIYLLNGTGFSSYLTTLEYGLKITEIANSRLPVFPIKIWIIQINKNIMGSNLVIGFEQFTIILKIEKMIFESNTINLITSEKTLYCTLMNSDNIIQITKSSIRHVRSKKEINSWKLPRNLEIKNFDSNSRQLIIEISNHSILYFELNCLDNFLQTQTFDYGKKISTLALPSNKNNSDIEKFFIIANNSERQFKILSLNHENWFSIISVYTLPLCPLNVKLLRINDKNLMIFISFENGTLLELKMNREILSIYQPKIRFIGTKPIKFSTFFIDNLKSILLLTNRIYLVIPKKQEIDLRILSSKLKITDVDGFSFSNKIILASIFKKSLTIFAVDNIKNYFSEINTPIYSRGIELLVHNSFKTLFILEIESYEKQNQHQHLNNIYSSSEIFKIFSVNKISYCISIIQILSQNNLLCNKFLITNSRDIMNCMEIVEYKINSVLIPFLLVGSRVLKRISGFLYIYRIYNKGRNFKLIYRSFLKSNPLSLININNVIIVGSESCLLFKTIGKKRLLDQIQVSIYNAYVSIMRLAGDRFIIGDFNNGILISKIALGKFEINFFARSVIGKYIENIMLLDYDTICISDLNGNFIVFRIPKEFSTTVEKGYQLTPFKNTIKFEKLKNIELISVCNIGECIKKLLKLSLLPWKDKILLYLTTLGGIGCFLPLKMKKEIIFLTNLNLFLHQENISLVFLNNYIDCPCYPNKRVFDAEFCESIKFLPNLLKISISKGLKVKIETITKYLDSFKLKVL